MFKQIVLASLVGCATGVITIDSLSSTQTKAFLDAHNNLRRGHVSTPDMAWDSTVQTQIQSWLDSTGCRYEHTKDSTSPTPINIQDLGENLYKSSASGGSPALNEQAVAQAWYDEIKDWDYGNPSAPRGVVGHFTQVVWKESTGLGCGSCTNSDAKTRMVMCRYSPMGNFWNGNTFPDPNGRNNCYSASVLPLKTTTCPTTNPCKNGGTCVDGTGTTLFTCSCANKYSGTLCGTAPPPPPSTSGSVPSWQTTLMAASKAAGGPTVWNNVAADRSKGWCCGGQLAFPRGAAGAAGMGSTSSDGDALARSFVSNYISTSATQIGCTLCDKCPYYFLRCVWGGEMTALVGTPGHVQESLMVSHHSFGAKAAVGIGALFVGVMGVIIIIRRRQSASADDYELVQV